MPRVSPLPVLLLAATLAAAPAAAACPDAEVETCFRPGPRSCAAQIVRILDGAQTSLIVQAYNFTAASIVQALGAAQARGLDVRVVLDRANRQSRYPVALRLQEAGVPVRIDERVAIAHNKVIVADGETVIGGSYNFTVSAEQRNAENLTFIRSRCVAREFAENFERRWLVSSPLEP